MKLNWKFLKNNGSEAVNFEPFLDAFINNGHTGFSPMSQQFYSYNDIESITDYVPVAKIIFHDLALYIGGRWCRVNIEFLTSIPNWDQLLIIFHVLVKIADEYITFTTQDIVKIRPILLKL